MGSCLDIIQRANPKWDPDVLFAYDTVKEVKVRDSRLGQIKALFTLMIVFYVVIWVFMIKQQYMAREKTSGWALANLLYHPMGAQTRPFDIFESLTNSGEQGAIFVPTRVLITRGQVQEGFCPSSLNLCKAADDCDIGDEETQKAECVDGRCMRRQWCPEMEVGTPTTEEHFNDIHNYDIWFATAIHFHQFALDVGTTDEPKSIRYPGNSTHPPNTYPVHDLLRMANIDVEAVKETGALVDVNKIFECDLDENKCHLGIQSRAVVSADGVQQGFNYATQHFYTVNGVTTRDIYRYYGFRFFAFATGIGKKTSFANVVLQLSAAIALLTSAVTATDVFLQYIVPEKRHYVELKVIQTEDFHLMEKFDQPGGHAQGRRA